MSTINYVVNAVDSASATFARIAGSADDLLATLDDLSHKSATARVGLEGDKDAELSLDKIDLQMARLGKRIASPNVKVDGLASSKLQLDALSLKLDELNHKHVTATVDMNMNRQGLMARLGGLLGGGGGGAGGAGGGLSSLFSGGLTSPAGLAGGGVAALLAAALAPGVIGMGLGGVTGLGAVGGGLFGAAQGSKILKADEANIKQITTALKTAIGKQKDQLSAALKDANKQYQKDSQFFAPFSAFQLAIKNLAQVFLKPLRPVMAPLTALFEDFGKSLGKLSPLITQVLDASIPFVHQFLNVLLQAGKNLLPAFSYALNQMVSSGALPLMTQGLVILTKGLANFIVALGPGMKASAMIFRDLAVIIAASLQGIGKAVSWVANTLEAYFHRVRENFRTAASQFDDFRHRTAVIFDGMRHDIAHIWDMIWNNTIGRVQRGISDVTGWFKKLPGMALGALFGLGHSLYAFARSALGELWSGFKSIAGSIINWIKGFGSSIINGLKGLFGIHSPSSVFHGIGENLMHGLLNGLKAGHGKVGRFLQSNVAGSLMGGVTGAFSASAAVAQKYAASLLSMYGWSQSQMGPLIALWNRESGWSSTAVNPSSGAYGIPQALPAVWGHPYALGDYRNQVVWGLNYIKQRPGYGSPAAAWAHEVSYGWYDQGGFLKPGWNLALNTTGRPEPVGAAIGRSGNTYNITVNVPPGANLAEAGRQTVAAIREFEKRAGKSWRS